MNAKKRILLVSIAILGVVLAVPAWNFIRVNSYTDKDRTVTLSNGQKVSVHLAEVTRIDPDKVKVSMEFNWEPNKRDSTQQGDELVFPDMTITRPLAARSPSFFRDALNSSGLTEYGNGHILYTASFNLKPSDRSIDISQQIYCRKPGKEVYVELPLTSPSGKHIVRKAGTAKVALIDVGKSTKYESKSWQSMHIVDTPTEGFTSNEFYVHVKQEDDDGSLFECSAFPRNEEDKTNNFYNSCIAELIDNQGQSIPMTANYIAKHDCEFLHNGPDRTSGIHRLFRNIRNIGPGNGIWIDIFYNQSMYIPGNGEWLYAFEPKPNHQYVKIRIKYQLPPKPQDKVTVRFDKVPI